MTVKHGKKEFSLQVIYSQISYENRCMEETNTFGSETCLVFREFLNG